MLPHRNEYARVVPTRNAVHSDAGGLPPQPNTGVVFITHMYVIFLATLPPDRSTMIGRVFPLAREVQRHGHTVRVVTLGTAKSSSVIADIPIDVVGPTLRDGSSARSSLMNVFDRLRMGGLALEHAIDRIPADVIVLCKPHPQNVTAIRNTHVPMVLDADDDERWASRLSFLERWYMGWIEKKAVRRADLITACSPYLVTHYTRELRGKKVALLPTGIDEQEEPAPDIRKTFGLPKETPIILYIGSLALSSGHRIDLLLDIWDSIAESHPDAHLVFAGDGIHQDVINAQARSCRYGNRIHFLGRYVAGAASGLARQATLLVDPVDSTKTSEAKSSSRVLLALRTGVPIIAGNVGIRRMLLPSSVHAWALYSPDNPERFRASVNHGLTSEARNEFERAARGTWEQWSWKQLGGQFVTLLEEIRRG